MDITSSSFGAVSGLYYAGAVQPRQATFTPSYGYAVPDSFQKQNPDDQDQQQQQNQEMVDVPGMEHHLIHQLHHI